MQYLFISLQSNTPVFIHHNILIDAPESYILYPEDIDIPNYTAAGITYFTKHTFLAKQQEITVYLDTPMLFSRSKLKYIINYLFSNPDYSLDTLNSLNIP